MTRRPAACVPAMLLLMAVACGKSASTPQSTNTTIQPTGPPPIDAAQLLENIRVLASDEYEGRAPGSKGEDLTVAYLEDQLRKLGLKPGNTDGTYIQKVPLVGITPEQRRRFTFRKGSRQLELEPEADYVAWTKHVAETARLDNTDLIFVGYGIVAPEFGWDDYKGVDVSGKTLVMLVSDPPVPDPDDPKELDPKMFGGKAMTYYGRWTYKYEIGAEKGAAGVIVIHETGPAGYPFSVLQSSRASEQFDLVTPDKNMGRAGVEAWLSLESAKRVFALAGKDFDTLKKQAVSRVFRPVPLDVTSSIEIRNKLRTVESRNVLALLEGSDPAVKDEYVVYDAHWDHLGIGAEVDGDRIYNGAKDNASGVAGLIETARAYTKLPVPPRRSILFLFVTAEEQGLLGSQYYSVAPIYPLSKTLANINIDGLNVHGRTRDITIIGLGNSDLDDYALEAATEQGRVLRPDAEPEKGFYYRSDHFNFAKQGVPALDPDEGIDFVGKPADFGVKVRQEYNERDYHKPSDEVKPDWDLSGAVEDLQLLFSVGYRVAQADKYPEWKSGTEFRAKREAQLKAGTSAP